MADELGDEDLLPLEEVLRDAESCARLSHDAARMTRVIWVGRAKQAALAVACGTCNATIGQPCVEWRYDRPHKSRSDYAHVLGFRDFVDKGTLFEVAEGSDPDA